jgi:hypothetical protein
MENCLSTEILYTMKLGGELVPQELQADFNIIT